jgi:predicted ATPase
VIRSRILAAVGPNAGLLTAVLPEFAALLGVPPDAGDPLTAQVRGRRAGVEVLRAVASRKRPVVLFADNLQWAGRSPLGFLDLVLSEEQIDGLLLVGAYREDDVDAAHPLAAPLSRWREQAAVQHVRLVNLPVPSLVTMVAEILHVEPATAAGLAEVINPRTSGNPCETVELLNVLRRGGVLTATAGREPACAWSSRWPPLTAAPAAASPRPEAPQNWQVTHGPRYRRSPRPSCGCRRPQWA